MNNMIRKMMTVVLLLLGSTPALYAQFNPTNPPEPDVVKPEEVVTYYTVTISASPASVADVPSGGKFTTGSSKYVYSARKNSSYRFSHWTLNGERYGENASFIYMVETSDADFVAHYVFDPSSPMEPDRLPEIVCYRLNLVTNNDAVCIFNQESGNEYEGGTMVTLEAFVNKGYEFKGWYNGTALVSKEKKFVYQMPGEDVTLSALVEKIAFNPSNPAEPDSEQDDVAVGSYHLIYMVDGQEYKVVNLKFGTEIVLEAPPTKKGYTFSGWSKAPATMPAEDVVIEGTFVVNTYSIIYKVDGEEYKVVPVVYGSEIVLIDAPVKEGHTFSGWSEAPATMPAEDITIEGSFAVNTYNVIYKIDGEEYKVVPVVYGSEIVVIEAPTKEGYTFTGWSEAPATMPAEDVVIEGTFVVNTYSIIYKVDGEEYKVVPVVYGSEIVLIDAPVKEGHTFSGWSEAPATMPAEDITIEGSFAVNTYNVIYKIDGEEYKVVPVVYGSEFVLIDEPAKEGHSFTGWSEAPATMPANDVTIEGSFTVNTYNVIYKVDGAEYKVVPVVYGSDIVLIDEPVKEGHSFSGWSEAPATMPAEDVIIEGSFAVNTYNVIYKVDGEEYKVVPVVYGSEFVLIDEPAKEGYTFSGWSEAPVTMPAEDVVVEGTFTVNTYSIIYKVDGEEYKVVPVVYGSEIVLIGAPVKEGHTFSGWSEVPATMPAEDVIIEGSFAVNTYSIIYKVDGEEYKVVPVVYGSEITLIDAPTKEGHTFSGWSEAPATMPAEDVIIEGSFAVNTYNVIYKVDGEEYKVVPVVYGSEITLIDEPAKEGYTFSGWSEAPATMPAEDITIEGSFAVNYYTVTYLVDGEVYATEEVAYGSEITLIYAPVKEGHTFSGWSEVPSIMPAEDITIEGSFAVNTYNVIYKVDGEEYKVVPVVYGSEIVLIDAPVKEGHTFSGWSEAPATMPAEDITIEGSFAVNYYTVTYLVDGEAYKVESIAYGSEIVTPEYPVKDGFSFSGWQNVPATMPAEDITIEGSFTVNTYNVIYKVDGEEYKVVPVAYGSEIVLIDEPTKEGYTFSGWSEAPATMPAEDVVIEGSFTVNTYNVIYKVDGEEYKVVPVVYGSEIVLIDAPVKEGHTFSGWSEAPATMPANDVTIEGSFTVNTYNVIYKVDGEEYKVVPVAYGSEIVLIDEPTKEGYTFSGWSEAPATMPAEDVIVEGLFTVNYYTITYIVDGEVYATETVAYGSEITLIDAPVKEGHTFSGWSEVPATMPAEDVVIEGSFSPITTINGVVYDAEDLIIYNLRGERIIDVDELEQGFYIINGKKVWVK